MENSLREMVTKHFNESELRNLCFDLNIDYDDLAGQTKSDKVRELIALHQRQVNLPDLVHTLKGRIPNIDWDKVSPVTPPSSIGIKGDSPKTPSVKTDSGVIKENGEYRVWVLANTQGKTLRSTDRFLYFDKDYISPSLPQDLEATRRLLLQECQKKASERGSPFENNPLVRIIKLNFLTEDYSKFNVIFGRNEYFQYIPFRNNLDTQLVGSSETIREKYFTYPGDINNSWIPSEVSVNVILICRGENGKEKLVIPQRSSQVAQAPLRFSESVGEL